MAVRFYLWIRCMGLSMKGKRKCRVTKDMICLYPDCTCEPMTEYQDALLQAPYRSHSPAFLERMERTCTRIIFFDYSIAEKHDGRWAVTFEPGFTAEASHYVREQNDRNRI